VEPARVSLLRRDAAPVGILIIYSTLFIWSFAFIIGLGACGIEAAYFNQSTDAPTYAGVYAAWCNLREAVPYVFGYMMAAKGRHRHRG